MLTVGLDVHQWVTVVCDPPPPQQVLLTAGEHTLFIDATTNDSLYHFGAFYQFDLAFEAVP